MCLIVVKKFVNWKTSMQKTEFKKKRRKTIPVRTFTTFLNEGFMFQRIGNLGKALLCFDKVRMGWHPSPHSFNISNKSILLPLTPLFRFLLIIILLVNKGQFSSHIFHPRYICQTNSLPFHLFSLPFVW